MNYYRVTCKFGHVKRNHYIIKDIFIPAESATKASSIAKIYPRVKKNIKDAIINVVEISHDEYINGKTAQRQDLYFSIHNSSDQKAYNAEHYDEIYVLEKSIEKKKTVDNKHYKKMRLRNYRKYILNYSSTEKPIEYVD